MLENRVVNNIWELVVDNGKTTTTNYLSTRKRAIEWAMEALNELQYNESITVTITRKSVME